MGRPTADKDEYLPLSVEQASRVRALVREAFAAHGIEVTVHGDHVSDDQGRRFGLWNVAAVCGAERERKWRPLIANHVRLVVAGGSSDDTEALSDDELRSRTHLRLTELSQIATHLSDAPRRELGTSIAVVLAVDLPETVATPPASYWEDRGGYERWIPVGLDNLHLLVTDPGLRHEKVSPDGGATRIDVVMGDSYFAGSTALFVPEIARRFDPDVDLSHGFLVAVPFRHQMAYAPVVPGGKAFDSLMHLYRFATLGFFEAAGPVSPEVFLVRDGDWTQITTTVDGEGTIDVSGDVGRALGLPGDDN